MDLKQLTPSFEIFEHRSYRNFLIGRAIISAARQMVSVAIGWQVYDLARTTRSVEESAFLLGMIGLRACNTGLCLLKNILDFHGHDGDH